MVVIVGKFGHVFVVTIDSKGSRVFGIVIDSRVFVDDLLGFQVSVAGSKSMTDRVNSRA